MGGGCESLNFPCRHGSPACEVTVPAAQGSAPASQAEQHPPEQCPEHRALLALLAQPGTHSMGIQHWHGESRGIQRNLCSPRIKTLPRAPSPLPAAGTEPEQSISSSSSSSFLAGQRLCQPSRGAVGSLQCQGLCPPLFSQSQHNKGVWVCEMSACLPRALLQTR